MYMQTSCGIGSSYLCWTICNLQVDPNTGTAMYESDDIIKYLVDKYGTWIKDGHIGLFTPTFSSTSVVY